MAVVQLTPAQFSMVFFDHDEIVEVIARLAERLGFGADEVITVDVNETTPLTRVILSSIDPVRITAEGGALEDPKRPRYFAADTANDSMGRALLRALDRRTAGFSDAPADAALTFPQVAAWDTYLMGRIERLGYKAQKPRRLYAFRNRHGFTDVADTIFETIWSSGSLTWAELAALSEQALAAKAA
jgi:hypothetical protein